MIGLLSLLLALLTAPFKSRSRLEAENVVLRHQLIVLQMAILLMFLSAFFIGIVAIHGRGQWY